MIAVSNRSCGEEEEEGGGDEEEEGDGGGGGGGEEERGASIHVSNLIEQLTKHNLKLKRKVCSFHSLRLLFTIHLDFPSSSLNILKNIRLESKLSLYTFILGTRNGKTKTAIPPSSTSGQRCC